MMNCRGKGKLLLQIKVQAHWESFGLCNKPSVRQQSYILNSNSVHQQNNMYLQNKCKTESDYQINK